MHCTRFQVDRGAKTIWPAACRQEEDTLTGVWGGALKDVQIFEQNEK